MTNETAKIGVIQWTASQRVFDIWATINRHCNIKWWNEMIETILIFYWAHSARNVLYSRWHCWILCRLARIPHGCPSESHRSANETSSTWIMPKMWETGKTVVPLPLAYAFCQFSLCKMYRCWRQPLVHWTRHSRVTETLNLIPMGCRTATIASRIRMCRTTLSETASSTPIECDKRH